MSSSRRDFDRRGTDRDSNARRETAREPARPAAPKPRLNDYWIDGEGIHRAVLQTEICRFLGAEATCRPGDYNGRPGFKIKAQRPFTPEMLEDLRNASRDYRHETTNIQAQGYEVTPYEYSETNKQRNPYGLPPSDRYTPDYHQPSGPVYTMEPGTSYPAPSAFTAGGNYPAGAYPVVTGPGSISGYSTMPGEGSRFGSNYTYENPGTGPYAAQDGYYPQGQPYGGPPPRESGLGPGYRGPSGSDMSAGRGAPMDDSRMYYESMPPQAAAPVTGYGGAPYRGAPASPYDPYAGPTRDNYSSRPGAPSSEYRRR